MPKDLKVTLIQSDLRWHDPQANRDHFDQHIASISTDTDLIILPEMFSTGFTMSPVEVAESMNGPTMEWLHTKATQLDAIITGSFAIKEDGQYYNRLIWMKPDGNYETYDKRHLFAMAGEHEVYQAGKERLIVDLNGWKVCPMICYDLRFPVWSRNTPIAGGTPSGARGAQSYADTPSYDLLIYIANWPITRAYHWKTLLRGRAIENQSYVIGVNRVGQDKNGYLYNGDSCIVDPVSEDLHWHQEKSEAVHTMTLSYGSLQTIRKKLPFLRDGDAFEIQP